MKILNQIKPSNEERQNFQRIQKEVVTRLNQKLKDAEAILGGSGAKDTWLTGNHDVDIFILFDYKKFSAKSNQLSKHLEPVIKKAFPQQKLNLIHGSRDYFQFNYGNYNFEIVPILKLNKSDEAINITDVSPLHSKWVNQAGKNLKDDIRLAKQFCKANQLYGAESYIGGFSGYILEILTINYGSFEKLLKASQKWKMGDVVDVEKHYPQKDALFHLNKSKTTSPLVIIDPVDKNRNAAAALIKEVFVKFKHLAKLYLAKPNEMFFQEEEINPETITKKAGKNPFIFLRATPVKGKRDVIGVKIIKTFNHLKKELEPFQLKEAKWIWKGEGDAIFYFITKKDKLSAFEIRQGPPLKMKEFVKEFKKKNKNSYEKNGRIFTKVKIEHPKLKEFINHSLKHKYVQERTKEIKLV